MALAIHNAEIVSFLHISVYGVSFFARPLDLVTPVRGGKKFRIHVVRSEMGGEGTCQEAPGRRLCEEGNLLGWGIRSMFLQCAALRVCADSGRQVS